MKKTIIGKKPLEIAWLGRGGQGVVTACQTLAKAALLDGKYAQAFPEFGPERTGAPIKGFNRVCAEPIDLHNQIYEPDIVVVIDPTLIPLLKSMSLKPETKIVVNAKADGDIKGSGLGGRHVFTVDATRIAIDTFGKALFNTPMLGALVRVSGVVSMDSLKTAVTGRFGGGEMGQKNFSAIERAYKEVKG